MKRDVYTTVLRGDDEVEVRAECSLSRLEPWESGTGRAEIGVDVDHVENTATGASIDITDQERDEIASLAVDGLSIRHSLVCSRF